MAYGKIVADQIQHSSEGTVGTQYVVSGSAKAWSNVNCITTTVLNDSLNISGLTDVGVGKTTLAHTNSMLSGYYSVTTACALNGDSVFGADLGTASIVTTSSHRIQSRDELANFTDPDIACSQVIGDLA